MFYKSAKISQWGKEIVFSTNDAGTIGYLHAKKLTQVGPFPHIINKN